MNGSASSNKKIVIGITGATGALYGIRCLECLRDAPTVETHLIVSDWGKKTISVETGYTPDDVRRLADVTYDHHDLGAAVASGSFFADGMAIVPCSMKTLSAVSLGFADNLIARAADVFIKENRMLILCPRETPLSVIHLENMLKLCRIGVKILPPMPAFYHNPTNIDDIISHFCMKVMDMFGIDVPNARRWSGK